MWSADSAALRENTQIFEIFTDLIFPGVLPLCHTSMPLKPLKRCPHRGEITIAKKKNRYASLFATEKFQEWGGLCPSLDTSVVMAVVSLRQAPKGFWRAVELARKFSPHGLGVV